MCRTPLTIHVTNEQDLNPRSYSTNDHLSVLSSRDDGDRFPVRLWETWFCSTLGVPIPVLMWNQDWDGNTSLSRYFFYPCYYTYTVNSKVVCLSFFAGSSGNLPLSWTFSPKGSHFPQSGVTEWRVRKRCIYTNKNLVNERVTTFLTHRWSSWRVCTFLKLWLKSNLQIPWDSSNVQLTRNETDQIPQVILRSKY